MQRKNEIKIEGGVNGVWAASDLSPNEERGFELLDMKTDDDEQKVLPFQLQFDKPIPSQIKVAEWNPEKDLLAMVTEDSKIALHRFNWQRLWTISPGKCVTSLCWRPDGKALAVGLEDGTISLHNVENGKLLRSMKSHSAAVTCLSWEEEDEHLGGVNDDYNLVYEDRTLRFFPPPPRPPRMTGVVSGDANCVDESEDSFQELLNSSYQCFNVLCSVDSHGNICFSIFGIFPIGKVNIHRIDCATSLVRNKTLCRLLDAFIYKVALSKDLCRLIITCSGKFSGDKDHYGKGLHCLVLDTSIFKRRRIELHQLAQQASNVENLTEVIRTSLSVMCKQWIDVMHTFQEKFSPLSALIVNHGVDSSPQEEFLSLLGGARTSPPVHQFLVNTLGESGLKRVTKSVCSVGKELQHIVLDHLQPATEIIGFRIGELKGLSRWRTRYRGIGLDENLVENAAEKVGMFLVQVERFTKIFSSVLHQFTNFFGWLLKCIKILMSEPSDQLPPYNSELVVTFLKFLYDQDPVGLLLEQSAANHHVEIDSDTFERVQELAKLGGFSDVESLTRTLAKAFLHMESSFKEAFDMPFTAISQKILCQHVLPLLPFPASPHSELPNTPSSILFCKDPFDDNLTSRNSHQQLMDYVCIRISDNSVPGCTNCIGIVRSFVDQMSKVKKGYTTIEGLILSIPRGFECVDLSLYKDSQIVLILNKTAVGSSSSGSGQIMMLQASGLSFVSIPSCNINFWSLPELKDSILHLKMEQVKVRAVSHHVVPPLAVSSSRGVACIFAARKRALVYILDEDDEDVSDVD